MSRVFRLGRCNCIAAATAFLVAALTARATDFPESEPNENRASATVVTGMQDGDTLSGITTGSTSVAGANSWDFFRVQNATRPPGIYRHRLTITTTGAFGHAGNLRGLDQSGGTIGVLDTQVQASNTNTTPPRFN